MTVVEIDQTKRSLEQFSARVAAEGTATVVTFRGEADAFTLPAVLGALTAVISDHEGPVVVDLAETSFIDLGTVRTLGRAARFLAYRGRTLTVRAPSRMALYLLAFLGVADLIPIEPPRHERLDELGSVRAPLRRDHDPTHRRARAESPLAVP